MTKVLLLIGCLVLLYNAPLFASAAHKKGKEEVELSKQTCAQSAHKIGWKTGGSCRRIFQGKMGTNPNLTSKYKIIESYAGRQKAAPPKTNTALGSGMVEQCIHKPEERCDLGCKTPEGYHTTGICHNGNSTHKIIEKDTRYNPQVYLY